MSKDICLWDRCNNRCLMCTNPDRPWPAWDGSFDYDYQSLVKRIKKASQEIGAGDCLYLSGGEPTLHPYFLDLIKYLADNFPEQRIKLLTNGRRFFYSGFAKRFLAITDNLDVNLSIYGSNRKIHDAVTRSPGSFEQTISGLKNLLTFKKQGQLIDLRFVMTKLSYKGINELLELLAKDFSRLDRVILIFPEIENQAKKNLNSIKITYRQVRPYLKKSLPLFKNFKEVRLYHFPLCAIPENLWLYAWRTVSQEDVTFLPFCRKCEYRSYCLGIQKDYLKNIGSGDFGLIKKRVKIQETGNIHHPILSINKK